MDVLVGREGFCREWEIRESAIFEHETRLVLSDSCAKVEPRVYGTTTIGGQGGAQDMREGDPGKAGGEPSHSAT